MPEYGKIIGVKTPRAPGNLPSTICVFVERETEKAYLLKPAANVTQTIYGGRHLKNSSDLDPSPLRPEWFPKSQVKLTPEIPDDEFSEGEPAKVTAKDWLFEAKKWI